MASSFLQSALPAEASCTETTKFVQNVNGTNLYYGNRASVGRYDHFPYCSPYGVMRASTFMRLSDDYFNFIELGPSQGLGDSSGTAHIWTEWRAYPAPAQVFYWDTMGLLTNHFYSFMIANLGSGLFELDWANTNNPDTANWQFLTTSPAMGRNVGEVESEAARIGSGDAFDESQIMEKQNRFLSSWGAWDNLQCDKSQNSMHNGWNAVRFSNQRWENKISSTGLCA